VYGPFKKFVNREMDQWMTMHPGSRMTIYDIPQIVAGALPDAVSPRNIMSGFKVSGIWPFNRNIFGEDEFAPSIVTDVEKLQTNQIKNFHSDQELVNSPEQELVNSAEQELHNSLEPESHIRPDQIHPSSNISIHVPMPSTSYNRTIAIDQNIIISPESIRPYPKAVREQKLNRKGRKKRQKRCVN
jgi:hypothetical protein